jgi:hypothetical protein
METNQYEIPGFEGFRNGHGKSTSIAKKILTNQDAIALIIDVSSSEIIPWAARTVVLRKFQSWRGQRPTGHGFTNNFGGQYFQIGRGHMMANYPYCGDTVSDQRHVFTKSGVSEKYSTKSVVDVLWYRHSPGRYALTNFGKSHVENLKKNASIYTHADVHANDVEKKLTESRRREITQMVTDKLAKAAEKLRHREKCVKSAGTLSDNCGKNFKLSEKIKFEIELTTLNDTLKAAEEAFRTAWMIRSARIAGTINPCS